ncbi:autotransporter outer membrane beta-barrel domain-containing protein [Helicobacter sp. 11S03491-1]|uniref:autotransporter outer membrane beta-barrel domain-containing protein n=1 Tax=Helicobacter sp. 11S03491-1 TaxID=1476196 RepID=UPI000BA5589A|nr:autotransporter outer membrane beta-barrel domain-containing protein [Helicobacter sp. 11S03491-1]PAF43430.1 hypothetical protein BKH45_02035 [Helicobacter sp. 11S03491-1]
MKNLFFQSCFLFFLVSLSFFQKSYGNQSIDLSVPCNSLVNGYCVQITNPVSSPNISYTSADHKNVSLDLNNAERSHNSDNSNSDTFMLKAFGKSSDDRINLFGNIFEHNTNGYRNLSIDFDGVNYYGNMTFEEYGQVDKKGAYGNIKITPKAKFVLNHTMINGDLIFHNYYISPSEENSFSIKNSTINGNFHWDSENTTSLINENNIFNGNVEIISGSSVGTSLRVFLKHSVFNHSNVYFGVLKNHQSNLSDVFSQSIGSYFFYNDVLNDAGLTIMTDYNYLIFKNTTFKGGSMTINNASSLLNSQINFMGSDFFISNLNIIGNENSLGVNFVFDQLSPGDKDVSVDQTKITTFEGNITFSGGKNTLDIKNHSVLKNGTIFIEGGINVFNTTDSTWDNMNISISRKIYVLPISYRPSDTAPNGYVCTIGSRICYSDSTNTLNFNNSVVNGGNIMIVGGHSNTLNYINSPYKNGNITIFGGETNKLSFLDSLKERDILIAGGARNTLEFKNTILSSQSSDLIGVKPTAHMSVIKGAILAGTMTPEFLKMIENTPADLLNGNLILDSASTMNTINTLSFINGILHGNITIENHNTSHVNTAISIDNSLLLGDISLNGKNMFVKNNLTDAALIGDVFIDQGVSYTSLDNSQIYGDITTRGGINIFSLKNSSVFAGSIDTFDGTSFIDLNMSLYANQNGQISKINTYGGVSNISLSINDSIAGLLTSQHIYPTFYIGNYNRGISNIAISGPVSGTALIDYSGGRANIIFADGGNSADTTNFFANKTQCEGSWITQECLNSGKAIYSPTSNTFEVNGYTYENGLAITLDASMANKVLKPFRDVYSSNYVSLFIDKSGVNPNTHIKDDIYRMKIDGVIIGGEYNLPSTSDQKYEITFAPRAAFIGNMFAKTDNTTFVLSQGSKLVLYNGSLSVISSLTSSHGSFSANTDTMFAATLAQRDNTIIDLATSGKEINNTFQKDTFSTMIVNNLGHFNNAIFRVAIDSNRADNNPNIHNNSLNSDRIIIQDVGAGQHLSNYLQVYQDYTSLATGDLSANNILVAIVKDSSDSNSNMIFDTSASKVEQGYDIVNTILYSKRISVDATGKIDTNVEKDLANATGYFVRSASTAIDKSNLGDTNNAITSNYSIFLANINNLNKRLGELRNNYYAQGIFSRVYSGLNTSNRGDKSKIYATNIQVGYDYGWNTAYGEQFLGSALNYGYNTIRGGGYNGSANMLEFGGYYSFVNESGFYTDSILKYTYIHSNISIKNNNIYNVPLDSHGVSLGQELGYRYYTDKKKRFYLEPSAEIILGWMSGGVINQVNQSSLLDYRPDYFPYFKADLNYIFNFRSKLGANVGYRLMNAKNQTDFRLGAFWVSDVVSGGVIRYKTNYSQAQTLLAPNNQMMINLGLNSVVSENWRVYADVDTGFLGRYFNQNYLVSIGLRYEFGHALNPLAAKLTQEKRLASIRRSQMRFDERLANISAKQEKIKQKQAFEEQKSQIIATKKAQAKTLSIYRKQEDKVEKNDFKMIHIEIAKILKSDQPSGEKIKVLHAQELKVFEASKARKIKEFNDDYKGAFKTLEARYAIENEELQAKAKNANKVLNQKSEKSLKDLEANQAKELQELNTKNKSAFEIQEAKLHKDPQKAKKLQDLQNKQTKVLKDLQTKQAKALQNLQNHFAKASKEIQNKQVKDLKSLKTKLDKQTKDLQTKQAKDTKKNESKYKTAYQDLLKRQAKEVKKAQELEKEMDKKSQPKK